MFIAQSGKVVESLPVPRIKLCQVVLAKPVPGAANAGVSERLFKVRWSNVAISLMDHGVIVAPSIVPEPIVMIENRNAFGEHLVANLLQIVCESRPNAAGYEAR